MKTRKGFVSNSSSSSFIVAVDDKTTVAMTVEVDLTKFGEVITTEEELDKKFEYDFGDNWREEEEWYVETYNAALIAINKGKKIIMGAVSNEGLEPEEYFIYAEGFPKTDGMEVIMYV